MRCQRFDLRGCQAIEKEVCCDKIELTGRVELAGVGKVGVYAAGVGACALHELAQHRIACVDGIDRDVAIAFEQLCSEPSVSVTNDECCSLVPHFGEVGTPAS
jgi:hypothetical protein